MKIILILFVLLALGGGGAYYYLVIMNQEATPEESMDKNNEEMVESSSTGVEIETEKATATIELGEYYVSSSSLNVRQEANPNASISSVLDIGDKVLVLESNQGWARISEYNEYVDGKFAQWVSDQYLTSTLPDNLAEVRSARLEIDIKGSDNFLNHRDLFLSVSQRLINEGKCTNNDFKEIGGWLKSVIYQPRDVYYTYCGGLDIVNKIYLDAESGQLIGDTVK